MMYYHLTIKVIMLSVLLTTYMTGIVISIKDYVLRPLIFYTTPGNNHNIY